MIRFKTIIYFLVIASVLSFLIIEGLIINEVIRSKEDKINHSEIDYIIVLGARLYGSVPSPALYERLKITVEYMKNPMENEDIKIIVTGGQGEDEDIPESHAMKDYLNNWGVREDKIITEEKSTSTYENLKFAKKIINAIDKEDKHKILIVTSDFHMFRSKLIGERLGFEVYGLPAETPKIIKFKSYVREYFAVIKSFIVDRP